MSKKKKDDGEQPEPDSNTENDEIVSEKTPEILQPTKSTKQSPTIDLRSVKNFPGKKNTEGLVSLSSLAGRFHTSAVELAALKAEYGWADATLLTADRYREALDSWLVAPAGGRR
jgi:hypothetical protein